MRPGFDHIRGKQAMTHTAQLREQADILRTLARSFNIPSIRDQLLAIAARCETLALALSLKEEKLVSDNPSSASARFS